MMRCALHGGNTNVGGTRGFRDFFVSFHSCRFWCWDISVFWFCRRNNRRFRNTVRVLSPNTPVLYRDTDSAHRLVEPLGTDGRCCMHMIPPPPRLTQESHQAVPLVRAAGSFNCSLDFAIFSVRSSFAASTDCDSQSQARCFPARSLDGGFGSVREPETPSRHFRCRACHEDQSWTYSLSTSETAAPPCPLPPSPRNPCRNGLKSDSVDPSLPSYFSPFLPPRRRVCAPSCKCIKVRRGAGASRACC